MCEKGIDGTARTKSHIHVGRLAFLQLNMDTISHQLLNGPCPSPPGDPGSGPSSREAP